MLLGVRAHDFGRQDADSLFKKIAAVGFNCCQIAPAKAITGINHFNDITDAHMEEIATAADKHAVALSVLGCYIEPSVADTQERLANVEIFKRNLTLAKNFRIPIVGTETTMLPPDALTEVPTALLYGTRRKVYDILLDSVLRMVDHAEKENVIIGIEPVADHTLHTATLTRRLLDDVGSNKLKVIFDPVNILRNKTTTVSITKRFISLLYNDIVALHIKDTSFNGTEKVWQHIGDGIIDYALIAKLLADKKIPLLREGVKPETAHRDFQTIKEIFSYNR